MRLPSSLSGRRQRDGASRPAGGSTEDGSTLTLPRDDEAPATVRPRTRAEREPLSPVDRWLSTGAVLVSVAALVVLAGLPSRHGGLSVAVRGMVLLAFWLAGPGSAVVAHLRLRTATKLSQAPLLGLALLIAVSLVGAWTGVWIPRLAGVVVAALTLLVAAVPLVRRPARSAESAPGLRIRPSTLLLLLGVLACLALWVAALPGVRDAEPSIFGLLATGPLLLPASLLGLVAVLLIALRGRRPVVAGVAVAALIVVLRTTASAALDAPGPSWGYKHMGVVNVLLEQHALLPGPDIYMNWPGMFAASAYFSDMSGVGVLDLARWITPLVHVLVALQVAALARVLGASATGSSAAAALVVVLNWVGQDYFAPQAVALCLAGGVLVAVAQAKASRTSAVLGLGLFAAVVATHQLTPFWLLGLAIALAVLRRTPWWLPVLMAVILAAYVLPRLDVVEAYGIFSGFDPVGNASNNVPVGVVAEGSRVGSLVARATVVVMWLSTVAVLAGRLGRPGWRRPWRNGPVVVAAVIAFSPIALLGGQNYGGEAINRVILYSSLGCAAVLGPALAAALRRGTLLTAAAVVWTLVAGGLAVQASFNQWFLNAVRSEDVAAARALAREAPNAYVLPVVFNWPSRAWLDYERYFVQDPGQDASLDGIVALEAANRSSPPTGQDITVADLDDIVYTRVDEPTYVVFTASMEARDDYYGTFAPGSYESLLAGLKTDPDWRLVRHDGDTWVFRFAAPGVPRS